MLKSYSGCRSIFELLYC